jgi:hypothetical protein
MNQEELDNKLSEVQDKFFAIEQPLDNRISSYLRISAQDSLPSQVSIPTIVLKSFIITHTTKPAV